MSWRLSPVDSGGLQSATRLKQLVLTAHVSLHMLHLFVFCPIQHTLYTAQNKHTHTRHMFDLITKLTFGNSLIICASPFYIAAYETVATPHHDKNAL